MAMVEQEMAQKVLIIDDDPAVLVGLQRLLKAKGFEVSSAATAGEGMAALDGQDIAIIDLHLPDALGIAVLHKIRRDKRPVRTAIFSGEPDLATFLARGPQPDAMFGKLEVDRLLAWIEHVPGSHSPTTKKRCRQHLDPHRGRPQGPITVGGLI
jgi:DNA-binding NtrC family response regulator